MRIVAALGGFVFAIASTLEADIRFPTNSFEAAELTEAQESARQRNLPIAFVYTEKRSTCRLCQGATAAILQEFRSAAVIVYVEQKGDVPAPVGSALSSKGKYIPKVALFSPDLAQGYGVVSYEEIKAQGDRPLRELKRTATAALR